MAAMVGVGDGDAGRGATAGERIVVSRGHRIADWFNRPARRGYVIVLFLLLCAVLGGTLYAVTQVQSVQDTIQQQRVEAIRASCESSNQRNRALKALTLKVSPPKNKQTAKQRAGLAYVFGFVDLLVPSANCKAQVARFASH